MTSDTGPYQNDDGDVWVPRTVPYLEARGIAKSGFYDSYRDRLVYIGKEDATLLGFSRDCRCDEVCELANRCRSCGLDQTECACETPDAEDWDICLVPAWHFRLEEAR